MSLSAEYCSEKTGGDGGGLAHQRKLIRGLLVWATLLTLGLASSITLHFIYRESPAPDKPQTQEDPRKISDIISFSPNWLEKDVVELLQWKTQNSDYKEEDRQLKVKYDGLYFLYLQVTLVSRMKEDNTITLQSKQNHVILKSHINGSNLSTGFMGKAIKLARGDVFNVTCVPKAKIQTLHTATYLGMIKIH
ncbi:tumor necrosis factor ligand superfamily member 18 isoform X2 [Siphateles boraxobius]|uniref:tumor necrosis factor ligand superfamily member 18 isoform X2 n=1 Tax=Siphateles boraxobius TaxID=180520 RepID=UPI004063B144